MIYFHISPLQSVLHQQLAGISQQVNPIMLLLFAWNSWGFQLPQPFLSPQRLAPPDSSLPPAQRGFLLSQSRAAVLVPPTTFSTPPIQPSLFLAPMTSSISVRLKNEKTCSQRFPSLTSLSTQLYMDTWIPVFLLPNM